MGRRYKCEDLARQRRLRDSSRSSGDERVALNRRGWLEALLGAATRGLCCRASRLGSCAMEAQEPFAYIRDVWHDNLEAEMATIREMVEYTVYIDGALRPRPFALFARRPSAQHSQIFVRPPDRTPSSLESSRNRWAASSPTATSTIRRQRTNVNLLKIIQLGLTFSNDDGELAPGVCTYQFNFTFSLGDDIYAQDSIDLLTRSGIDFRRHEEYGIDVVYFAELLISSGCVLNDEVRWISFPRGTTLAT